MHESALIPSFGEPDRGWLILAMASTLAGNPHDPRVGRQSDRGGGRPGIAREDRVPRVLSRRGPLTVLTLLPGWLILIAVPV